METEINKLFKIEQEKIITNEKIKKLNKPIYEMSKINPVSEKYEEMFVRGFKLGMRLSREVYN